MDRHSNDQKQKSVPPTQLFVSEYDRLKKERQSFEREYKRQTYLIRRELVNKVDDLCKKRPGFKTKFINYALERCLTELEDRPELDIDETHPSTISITQTGELLREGVEMLLEQTLRNSGLDTPTQNSVQCKVMTQLFEKHPAETRLRNGERFQSPAVKIGRGFRCYKTATECVEKLIEFWVSKAKKNDSALMSQPPIGADTKSIKDAAAEGETNEAPSITSNAIVE
jgi:hypothetical protein